jgi:hypothetical protein
MTTTAQHMAKCNGWPIKLQLRKNKLEDYSLLTDHLMVHGPQCSSLLLFTTLLIQRTGEVLTHKGISRLVACVVVFD